MKTPTLPHLTCLCLAGALLIPGCADRNKNGQPDSLATESEIKNSAGALSRDAETAVDKMKPGAEKVVAGAGNLAEAAVITPQVKLALKTNPALKGETIDVDTVSVKDTVKLSGTVKSQAQKKLAGQIAAQKAPGYQISNQLKVTP